MAEHWSPAFDRRECRVRYEEAFAALISSRSRLGAGEFAAGFIELEALLDDGMVEVKDAMLDRQGLSEDERQALGVWIYRQHRNLMKVGEKAVHACAAGVKIDPPRMIRMLGLALLHYGEMFKCELMVGRREPREHLVLHRLLEIARGRRAHRVTGELVVDGRRRRANVEQLYLRALLLDRFTSGNLTGEQVAVLDAWLWEWADALGSQARYPGGSALRADLDQNEGLQFGKRVVRGPCLYLDLAPLEERRRGIVASLHRGFVVPSRGRAARIALEEHVAVLNELRKLFTGASGTGSPRAPRHDTVPAKVEVHLGIEEIAQAVRRERPARGRRMLTARSASATGYLLVGDARAAADLAVGSLVGLRVDTREAPILGRVARRVRETSGEVHVGVQVLSHPDGPIRTATLVSEADGTSHEFVFVPGADRSGRFDSFAIAYQRLGAAGRYRVAAGGAQYSLTFNRVHRRGKGWALAGFEIASAA